MRAFPPLLPRDQFYRSDRCGDTPLTLHNQTVRISLDFRVVGFVAVSAAAVSETYQAIDENELY